MNAMKKKSNHPVLKKEIREREKKKPVYTMCVRRRHQRVSNVFQKRKKNSKLDVYIF